MSPQPKLDVLFVDDESRILDGLRRQLRPLRSEWTMRFAESGHEALQMLEAMPADVVVADMRMPSMTGSALLRLVQAKWPQTLRIILSGQTDQAELIKDIGAIHQFLQKPCDPTVLQSAIRRAYGTRELIESPNLRRISAGVSSLPIVPENLRELLSALGEEASASTITEIIEHDMALTTKVLQLVNTSFFGIPRKVTCAKEAVTLLGTKSIRTLAVATWAFESVAQTETCGDEIRALWLLSTAAGARAEALARAANASADVISLSMLAGTLSLIGRALLLRYSPDTFKNALHAAESGERLHLAESKHCGVPQQHIGGYALGLWAFPDEVVEAVTYQATPSMSSVNTSSHPLVYLHAARCVPAASKLVEQIEPDMAFYKKIGLDKAPTLKTREAA